MAMWSPDYDIIVETLTGSEFEVTVRETDTIGYLKYRIKKYEGIPVSQQHILFNQAELKDSTVLKDVPLGRGSRLTLVLGMRGGPISARRVVADCDNWFDLSDVLNGTNNRGQLAPIEPLTISTTGVKVLLYKDCKKNINRLMKLRKHHLHSHGASGVTGTSMAGLKGSASGGFSARTQLKFLDKNLPVGENGIAAAEPQDQQWLLDNITTLKKMKNVRQSLEAKKKKKPRPNDPQAYYDEFAQDLRDVQMDREMHEKLQRWLHRVASNATHLSDAETMPPHHKPPSSSKMPPNLFDRVRRKSAGTAAEKAEAEGGEATVIANSRTEGFMHHPFSRAASLGGGGGAVVGGARKKDSYPSMAGSSSGGGAATAMISSSAYSIPGDEFALIARDYRKAAAAVALNKLSDMVDNDETEDQYTKLSTEEIDRRLEAANGAIAGEEMEGMKKRRESNSQFEERLLTQFYDSSSTQYENMFRAYASTDRSSLVGGVRDTGSASIADQKMVSKFRWRFHSETDGASGATVPDESDQFLNSLLLKRNKTANRPLPPAGYDYRRWADTVQGRGEEVGGGSAKQQETTELTEVATVIIGKAEENSEEESLLEAACSDILNDPEAFDEEDEQLKEVHDNRFQLIDLMGLDSSGDSDSGGEFSMLKNEDFFDLEDDEEGHTNRAEDEDPVLLYEEEDTGSVAFLGGDRRKGFWPHFDIDHFGDAAKEEEEEEIEEQLAMALPGPSSTSAAKAEDVSDEEENPNCSENEGLEFDDFAYFPTPSPFQSNAFRKQSSSLRPTVGHGARKGPLLPRISSGGDVSAKEAKRSLMAVNHLGGECVAGPSFPEIISRGSQRRHEGAAINYSSLEHMSPGGGGTYAVKREREQPPTQEKAHKVQLPDIKLLESDLKRMGLDTILNDSDDSFERTIKKHLRSEESVAYGECLLRSGNEEAKKPEENSEWLIQLAVNSGHAAAAAVGEKQRAANRCAKCNKKLGIIMIMKCHCGLFFCAQHRYAEAHDCSYDFKEEGKRILTKENPLVVGEKLPKI